MFTTEVQQSLRALVALAGEDAPVTLAQLAGRVQAPAPALGKVLHRLSRLDLVVGQPGPGGGYRLARPAASIRLADVVEPLQGPGFARSCLFGLPHCSDDNPCPLHPIWGALRGGLLEAVEQRTVADLAQGPLTAVGLPGDPSAIPAAPA